MNPHKEMEATNSWNNKVKPEKSVVVNGLKIRDSRILQSNNILQYPAWSHLLHKAIPDLLPQLVSQSFPLTPYILKW